MADIYQLVSAIKEAIRNTCSFIKNGITINVSNVSEIDISIGPVFDSNGKETTQQYVASVKSGCFSGSIKLRRPILENGENNGYKEDWHYLNDFNHFFVNSFSEEDGFKVSIEGPIMLI